MSVCDLLDESNQINRSSEWKELKKKEEEEEVEAPMHPEPVPEVLGSRK